MSKKCTAEEIQKNVIDNLSLELNKDHKRLGSNGVITFDSKGLSQGMTKNEVKKIINTWLRKNFNKFSKGWIIENGSDLIVQIPKYLRVLYDKKDALEVQEAEYKRQLQEDKEAERNMASATGLLKESAKAQEHFKYQEDITPKIEEIVVGVNDKTDFTSYQREKKETLRKLENNFKNYKILNIRDKKTEKYKKDVYEYETIIQDLKTEIADIDPDAPETIYYDIINQIKYLTESLNNDTADKISRKLIRERIRYFSSLAPILGSTQQLEGFDSKVLGPLKKLELLMIEKNKVLVEELLKGGVFYKNYKKVRTDELLKDNTVEEAERIFSEEIQRLFNARTDINQFQKTFLGINSNDDTVVPTLLKTIHATTLQKVGQFARVLEKELVKLDEKLIKEGFDAEILMEKDDVGVHTGRIISQETKLYRTKLNKYYEEKSLFDKASNKEKSPSYKNIIAWLDANAIVIDFRKLKRFKEEYGDEYSSHFTSTDAEMEKYENFLKELLGPTFEDHMKEVADSLATFDRYKINVESTNNWYKNKNLQSSSPWVFLNNYFSQNKGEPVKYKTPKGTTLYTFSGSNHIKFIPKKDRYDPHEDTTTSTNFYSEDFQKISKNQTAFEYWRTVKKMNTMHINPTYSSIEGGFVSGTTWAKFDKILLEEFQEQKTMGKISVAFQKAVSLWKENFIGDNVASENGVNPNYVDGTKESIKQLTEVYEKYNLEKIVEFAIKEGVPTINKDPKHTGSYAAKDVLIDRIARKITFDKASKDLTKSTLALSNLATAHRARLEMVNVAETLLEFHKTIKKERTKDDIAMHKEGGDRKKSIAKVESWIGTNIYNRRVKERTPWNDKTLFQKIFSGKVTKVLSKTDKKIKKLLKGIKEDGGDFTFDVNGILYERKDGELNMIINGEKNKIPEKTFHIALEHFVKEEIANLGVDITLDGIGTAFLKSVIIKGLALNPQSGFFNRLEGMMSNDIKDTMGDAWSKGNIKHARTFVAGINLLKYTKWNTRGKKWKAQVETMITVLEELDIIQDKKNELARLNDKKWTGDWNIYTLAVDAPEYKIQAEVALAIFQDTLVEGKPDKNGVKRTVKFFDGSGFPIYKPGTTELLPEFDTEENQGWADFNLRGNNPAHNQFFLTKLKITDVINETQGNYDTNDSLQIYDGSFGKFLMVFNRWKASHINQRYGRRETNLIQAKHLTEGRHRGIMKNFGPMTASTTTAILLAGGPTMAGLFAGGAIVIPAFIMWKYAKQYDLDKVKHTYSGFQSTIGFLLEMLVQTVRVPYGLTGLPNKIKSPFSNPFLDKNVKLTEQDKAAIKGMAIEAAYGLSTLLLNLTLYFLFKRGDDEEENHIATGLLNWFTNTVRRLQGSLNALSNPLIFIEETKRNAIIGAIIKESEAINNVFDYFDKDKGDGKTALKNFYRTIPFVYAPRIIEDGILDGKVPFLDDRVWSKVPWIDTMFDGPEDKYKIRIKNRRAVFKARYKEYLMEKYNSMDFDKEKIEALTKRKLNKAMRNIKIKPKKGESQEDAYYRIKIDEYYEQLTKKK